MSSVYDDGRCVEHRTPYPCPECFPDKTDADQLRADLQKSVAAIVKRDEEIGRLRAEVERLKANEIEDAKTHYAIIAERDRLRAALERIVGPEFGHGSIGKGYSSMDRNTQMRSIARAALEGGE